MNTRIIKVDPEHPDPKRIRETGEVILKGGLAAFPTETVYGLGGNALDAQASKKIYTAKGRPSDNPLIVHIADRESLREIAEEVPVQAELLADHFWPGPLTMIFRKRKKVPPETTGGLDSVAVRMPSHPVAQELIRAAGGFVAAPSANTSGRPSPTCAAHVIEDLDGKIDVIVDGGEVGIGLESTIVDFTETVPTILRPGYINEEMLRRILGDVHMDRGLIAENSDIRPKAPGMKYRHYAPRGELVIVQGAPERVCEVIRKAAAQKAAAGQKVGIIATDESAKQYPDGIVKSIGARSDEESIAHGLYGVLREFDNEEVSCIYSEAFDTPRMGQAIMNRLLKAAGHQIIEA